jgi:sterol desaturase/sphingolipid hydroxylase (fatty acid hydroxylase superfamily)
MKKLKARWGVETNWQLTVIFIVFSITGSTAAKFAGPLTEVLGISRDLGGGWIYWLLRIVLIFPIYQILLVLFGWLFGEFKFFWEFEKKMLRHLGLGFLFPSEGSTNDNT